MIIFRNKELITAEYNFNSPMMKFGFGFFETILFNGKRICHLEKHILRMENSLRAYDFKIPVVNYQKAIENVLNVNQLENKQAKINIYAYENSDGEVNVDISAESYNGGAKEYKLNIHNKHQVSHLNEHKSMNWAHQFSALRRAYKAGYDNSLLIDENNLIFEAATGAILLKKGDKFVTTTQFNRLPSIALALAKEIFNIEERPMRIPDLGEFDNCFLLNSLIGAKPVTCISVFTFEPEEKIADKISEYICG